MSKDISIMIDNIKFTFRVGCIMQYKNSIIIEKSPKFKHSVIPGGRVMTLEDTKSALLRELKEEMNIDFSDREITFHHIIENFFTMNNIKYHEIYFVYKLILNDEDEIVKNRNNRLMYFDSLGDWNEFVDIDKLVNVNILPAELKEIVKSNEFGKKVVRDK